MTRNGRADEELGRTELLRSRILGLHAYSTASWLVRRCSASWSAWASRWRRSAPALDPDGTGITGSLIVGASITGVASRRLGVGAVAGQLASTSRGANTIASIVLGVFYVLRMVGDLGDGRSPGSRPIGWGQKMQPWGANRWWPLALLVAAARTADRLAVRLEARRDLGTGLVPERRGPAGAPRAWYVARSGSRCGCSAARSSAGPPPVDLGALLFGSVVQAMTDLLADGGGAANIVGGTGVEPLAGPADPADRPDHRPSSRSDVGHHAAGRRGHRDHRAAAGGGDVAHPLGRPAAC